MKQPHLAETMSTDTLERRMEAVEQSLATLCKNVGDMMEAVGGAFRAMSGPGGLTIHAVRVVDAQGGTLATVGPGGDGAGELVIFDPATGASVALRP